jgi:hypothetical protein
MASREVSDCASRSAFRCEVSCAGVRAFTVLGLISRFDNGFICSKRLYTLDSRASRGSYCPRATGEAIEAVARRAMVELGRCILLEDRMVVDETVYK